MKTALVTGSSGFVGRHMVRELKLRGYQVEPMDLDDAGGRRDMIDYLRGMYWHPPFDLVVHCAYRVGGRAGIDGSKDNLLYNLRLDTTLFEWASKMAPGRILYFSSSATYPVEWQTAIAQRIENRVIRLKEDQVESGKPDADYGWAKRTGERLAANYAANGGVVHVVRPFSGYGRDQSLDYPFPKFVQRAKKGQVPFEVWGDPTSMRDWIHIDDVVKGSLAVVESDCREPVNICTGIGTTFAELARMCMKQASYEAEIKSIDGPQGVHTRVGDPSKFFTIYRPAVSLEEGIRRAFE